MTPTPYVITLTCDSYEDDEPAPPAKTEPAKAEAAAQEPELQPREQYKSEDLDDFNFKTESDQHDVVDSYSAPQPTSEKPIGMKDDGYV